MLNLGYFSHTNFSPSETFIYDLVKALNQKSDIHLTYITGQLQPVKTDFRLESIASGYSQKNIKKSYYLYKLGQIRGKKGNKWKLKFQKRVAFTQLKKSALPSINVAYVDYATSAVLLRNYFKYKNLPFVVHVHGYDVTSALGDKEYKKELQKVFQQATYFIAASHYIRKLLIMAGCPEHKIKVIRYGVDPSQCTPIPWEKRKKTTPSVIFLGRLTAKKHPIALLYAFKIVKKNIPEAKLSIIGGGELEHEVKNTIQKLNLADSVKMHGILNREQSFPILNKHWIYAQHSVTANSGDQEGFAISLAEAALHELPVVSTYHNGIPENVIDGKTGLLVKEFDYEAMAEKIIYLIQHPEIAEQMGKAGRKHILQLCEPGKRVEQIKDLLFKAAGK